MILGVDHVAFSVESIGVPVTRITKGYELVFVERGVPNHPSKSHLLSEYHPFHDLFFYRAKNNSLNIECTNHGQLATAPPGPFEYCNGELLLNTSAIEAEVDFLEAVLRFKRKDGHALSLASPIPGWSCRLELKLQPDRLPCQLDSPGFTCLALFTNSLDKDYSKAEQAGAHDATEKFELSVNGKVLSVIIFRGPTGTLFELIEVRQ